MTIFNLFSRRRKKKKDKPKGYRGEFRLTPNPDGTYSLERWHKDIQIYLCERANITSREEADRCIANLGRKTLYWTEDRAEE